jgi:hypothetical protein
MEAAREACCGKRSDKTRGTTIREITDLFPLLKELPRDSSGWILRYECRSCGQIWEEHLLPFMHADVHVVVKEGVVADLADPIPPAPPPKPESPEVRALRFENRIFLACVVAGAVLGLLTRPPESAGARIRGNHFALCLLGGIAVGLILPLLRSFRKP